MKLRAKEDFTYYPNGDDKPGVAIVAGQVFDATDDLGALLVQKGHAVEVSERKPKGDA